VFSADATEQARKVAATAGAAGFLTKPVVVTRLLDALSDIAHGSEPASEPRGAATAAGSNDVISPGFYTELAAMGLDNSFVGLFIDECLNDAMKCISAIGRSGAERDWDGIREHCHALKGVAGNMGATALAGTATVCMNADPRELTAGWEGYASRMREQLEAARAALRSMREAKPVQQSPDGS
jgi:two-component system, sensor histidine kinase RpfC